MQFRTRIFEKSKGSYYCWVLVNATKVGNALIIHDTLFNFKILLAYRNRVYATAFMEKIIEHNGKLKRLHVNSNDLENGLSTKQLIKCYRKYGFKIKNRTQPYLILMIRKAVR